MVTCLVGHLHCVAEEVVLQNTSTSGIACSRRGIFAEHNYVPMERADGTDCSEDAQRSGRGISADLITV